MEKSNGTLGMCSRLNDRTAVVLEDLHPAADISSVIGARLKRQTKVGGQESCAKLGDIS